MVDFEATIENTFDEQVQLHTLALSKANTATLRRTSSGIRNDMKKQTAAADLGTLANTWDKVDYPKRGGALEPAAEVFSKFSRMAVFDEGATITAKKAKWLAIPTDRVGRKGKNQHLTPSDWPKNMLTFIPSRSRDHARLVLREGKRETTMYILVRQVRIKKRLEFQSAIDKWMGKVPATLLRERKKFAQKLGVD